MPLENGNARNGSLSPLVEGQPRELTALDFFGGSGLVTEGLRPYFRTIWANDVCPKKCAVYAANFGRSHLVERSIMEVRGSEMPAADLAWASFPCQDLSLAGNMVGMSNGTRSGLYWEWLRVLDKMGDARRPAVLCAENVVGFLVANGGNQFKLAYAALRALGYAAGALTIDAAHFVPQSRPRSFLIAVKEGLPLNGLGVVGDGPDPRYHGKSVMTARAATGDPEWIWWKLPVLPRRKLQLADVVEWDTPVHPVQVTKRLLGMLSPLNKEKLRRALRSRTPAVGTGYKRVRIQDGVKMQRLEIRFDGIAGCLRTPEGGSSRQLLVIARDGKVQTRLITVREAARLMGARDSYKMPGSYNDGYRAMGDAVAVHVTRWLARHLLARLCAPIAKRSAPSRELEHAGI